jgi:hypothetical protein
VQLNLRAVSRNLGAFHFPVPECLLTNNTVRGLLLEKRGVVEGGRSPGTPMKAIGVGGWPVCSGFENRRLFCEIVNFFFSGCR